MSEDEAKRDIRRLEAQQEKLLSPPPDHGDDGDDSVVKLGRRIARALGLLIAVGLAWYLWTQLRP